MPRLPKLATLLPAATDLAQPEVQGEEGQEHQVDQEKRAEGESGGGEVDPGESGEDVENQITFTFQSAPHFASRLHLWQSFEIFQAALWTEDACHKYHTLCFNQ